MSDKKSPAPKIFLLKAEFPVNLLMTRNAVLAATQIAELLNFTPQNRFDLELALEEAFSNAVEHFSKSNTSAERIHLEFTIEEGYLLISLRENGIPFLTTEAERFTPDTLEGLEKPGLGTFLMEQVMDSVEYFIHGRAGKETLMKKRISSSLLPQELVPTEQVKKKKHRPLVKQALIRRASAEDLPQICRLAWKCYGYTHEDLLYNIELLREKFQNGEVVPIIAIDPKSSEIIAHEALKYHDPEIRVPELGLAFIDPSYRCPHLTAELARFAKDTAAADGAQGIFDCSVTTHIYSQRAIQQFLGSSPCSIMLAIAASGMQARKLTTTTQSKGSVVNHYYPFNFREHTLYIPPRHRHMAEQIYSWLKLPRTFASAAPNPPVENGALTSFALPDELNVSFIIVDRIGYDSYEGIRQIWRRCKAERRDAIYLFIPSGSAHAAYLSDLCEELGFFFAGIMPHIHQGDDRLILQWLDIDLDLSQIKVYGNKSAELFSYVCAEKKRIESQL